jgi:hypothetical protein
VDSRAERVVSGRGFCSRETYLAAVAALDKEAGAGSKSARDQNYRDAMAVAYAQYPDDETTLFYGLSILSVRLQKVPTVEINAPEYDTRGTKACAKVYDAISWMCLAVWK